MSIARICPVYAGDPEADEAVKINPAASTTTRCAPLTTTTSIPSGLVKLFTSGQLGRATTTEPAASGQLRRDVAPDTVESGRLRRVCRDRTQPPGLVGHSDRAAALKFDPKALCSKDHHISASSVAAYPEHPTPSCPLWFPFRFGGGYKQVSPYHRGSRPQWDLRSRFSRERPWASQVDVACGRAARTVRVATNLTESLSGIAPRHYIRG
jgi:hypothetical protein